MLTISFLSSRTHELERMSLVRLHACMLVTSHGPHMGWQCTCMYCENAGGLHCPRIIDIVACTMLQLVLCLQKCMCSTAVVHVQLLHMYNSSTAHALQTDLLVICNCTHMQSPQGPIKPYEGGGGGGSSCVAMILGGGPGDYE